MRTSLLVMSGRWHRGHHGHARPRRGAALSSDARFRTLGAVGRRTRRTPWRLTLRRYSHPRYIRRRSRTAVLLLAPVARKAVQVAKPVQVHPSCRPPRRPWETPRLPQGCCTRHHAAWPDHRRLEEGRGGGDDAGPGERRHAADRASRRRGAGLGRGPDAIAVCATPISNHQTEENTPFERVYDASVHSAVDGIQ